MVLINVEVILFLLKYNAVNKVLVGNKNVSIVKCKCRCKYRVIIFVYVDFCSGEKIFMMFLANGIVCECIGMSFLGLEVCDFRF